LVGDWVGFLVGDGLGFLVGDGLGFLVGDSVSGCSVGCFVGISVGFAVGDLVGNGPLVGAWVVVAAVASSNQGSKLKNFVGDTVGAGFVCVVVCNQSSKLKNLVGDTVGAGFLCVALSNQSSKLKNFVGDAEGTGLGGGNDNELVGIRGVVGVDGWNHCSKRCRRSSLLFDASSLAEDEDARVNIVVYKRNHSSQCRCFCFCGWLENDDDLMVLFFSPVLQQNKRMSTEPARINFEFVTLLFGFWVLDGRCHEDAI
jgi:hypothetical protein